MTTKRNASILKGREREGYTRTNKQTYACMYERMYVHAWTDGWLTGCLPVCNMYVICWCVITYIQNVHTFVCAFKLT